MKMACLDNPIVEGVGTECLLSFTTALVRIPTVDLGVSRMFSSSPLTLSAPLKGIGKGIRFIVLYPPKRSHNLPPLAGLYTLKPFNPPRDIPEQLAAYSAHALSTALFMLDARFRNPPIGGFKHVECLCGTPWIVSLMKTWFFQLCMIASSLFWSNSMDTFNGLIVLRIHF